MDSLTQAALGAAVAEAGMGGKRLGNKAILWGALLGTLPDLDIVAYPWLDAVERLEWHRGISHSLIFMAAASPALGWAISKLHPGKVAWGRAAWTVFWILLTHVLIDVFTVYGTVVFAPFSDERVGFNNLFIIDPLFTLPLLAGLAGAVLSGKNLARRMAWNRAGIIVACCYVVWSFGAKAVADRALRSSLEGAGIWVDRFMSGPTPFNTVLWRGVARSGDDLWIGYYSLLDGKKKVDFLRVPLRSDLLRDLSSERAVSRLRWFSDDFLGARQVGGDLIVSDWRFGESPAIPPTGDPVPFFSWKLVREPFGELMPVSWRPPVDRAEWLSRIWRRIFDPRVKLHQENDSPES